jgi:AraC-like DNA-binding protein
MAAHDRFRAWRPAVAGVTEVLHAHFVEHAYPMHAHASWTLLIVDDGAVRYDLDRHSHLVADAVTLLPPHVPHNGRSATVEGFRKRVVYLDPAQLPTELIGRAVDQPVLFDAVLRRRIHQIHRVLTRPGEEFEAESRLALVSERLAEHLRRRVGELPVAADPPLARALRELIAERFRSGLTLGEAAAALHAHPAHLVRTFSREYGMSPHQYLTSLRVDHSRRLLLSGWTAAAAASASGFYDQSHLNRHFGRILGTSPARYARSGRLEE